MAMLAENDQQDPHWPWFLTALTAPLVLQSIPLVGTGVGPGVGPGEGPLHFTQDFLQLTSIKVVSLAHHPSYDQRTHFESLSAQVGTGGGHLPHVFLQLVAIQVLVFLVHHPC